jgi:mono/diheme cytochrome c family protein
MKRLWRVLGVALLTLVGLALLAYGVAWGIAKSRYEKQWVAHDADFPIPFPLSEDELAALRAESVANGAPAADPLAGMDLRGIALARAISRGERLVKTRVGCNGCHGADFGGRVLVDALPLGRWAAPNLTTGKGSVTLAYTASDWDHAVRHGLRLGGRTSTMPAVEFTNLSDRELSDIVAYIRSQPAVDRDVPKMRYGPVFSFLFASAPDYVVAYHVDHQKAHAREPPEAMPTAGFGEHLVQVCRGCHGPGLSGGKIQGDPDMPVVANLTPDATGLGGWSEADFIRALREGKRPDGSAISEYMPWKAYGRMSDEELKAIYAYLRTVPPKPKGNR